MNLLLLEPDELAADGRVRIAGRRALHLRTVLKVTVGDRLRAGVVGRAKGTATVVALPDEDVELSIEATADRAERPPVDLVLAVPRPKVLSRALQHAASFGVGRIDLINSWRVDKSYLDSPRLHPDSVREDLLLGCEQGQHTWLPEVHVHRRFMAFIDCLEESASPLRLLAHPEGGAPLPTLRERIAAGTTSIAIGPEGGWIERELETLEGRGFIRVTLSAAVLRSEVAVVAALAQLELVRAMLLPA